MKLAVKGSIAGLILRVKILDSTSTVGAGKTGMTFESPGLIISTITDTEAVPVVYTQAAGNIETIAVLGTFAEPTENKCRFKEVDAVNHKGLYEVQIADVRWATIGDRSIIISISGASGAAQVDAEIQLEPIPSDAVRWLGTGVPVLVGGRLHAYVGAMADDVLSVDAMSAGAIAAIQAGLATSASIGLLAEFVDTEVQAILDRTNLIPDAPAAVGDIPTVAQIWTTVLTEAYRATGAEGTPAQLLYEILRNLIAFRNVGTLKEILALNGTVAKSYTYDSATTPRTLSETS